MTTLSPTLPREPLTVRPGSPAPAHRLSVGLGLLVYAAGDSSLIAAAASIDEADLPAVAVAVGVVVILARAAVGWREGAALGAVAFAAIAGLPLLVLAPALDGGGDASLVTALAGMGLLVLAAGAASAFVPGLHAGHRESLAGALLAASAMGALAVLLAIGSAAALLIDAPGRDTLVAYVAAAAAVLALGEVLARHRCGAGFPGAPERVPPN